MLVIFVVMIFIVVIILIIMIIVLFFLMMMLVAWQPVAGRLLADGKAQERVITNPREAG